MNQNPVYHPDLHRFAFVTAGCTFFLLLAGALVTSTGSSLAVPDWPLSFGKFFPPMTGGVFYEHGHRMVAGTVAILMTILAFITQRVETRDWVKKLAWWALGAVVLQAVLGGVTVLMHLPTAVSVGHAGLAQIFFVLVVSLTLVTSRNWLDEKQERLAPGTFQVPTLSLVTTAAVYVQIILGAVMRHSGAGLAIPDFPTSFGQVLPPEWSFPILVNFCHRLGALVVLILVTLVSFRVCQQYQEERSLFWPAASAGLLVWLQCFLGVLVIESGKDVVPTSVHVIVGAAVLASMVVLTLKSFQIFKKPAASKA
jgi:cytochrome c oxidase assembly protein subunit 15